MIACRCDLCGRLYELTHIQQTEVDKKRFIKHGISFYSLELLANDGYYLASSVIGETKMYICQTCDERLQNFIKSLKKGD